VGKKANLPLFTGRADRASDTLGKLAPDASKPKKPSIDAARVRLGGRLTSADVPVRGLGPGAVVTFALGTGDRIPGVVVFASVAEVHVLLDGVRLRRFAPSDLEPFSGDPGLDLEKLAADARVFGNLTEGQAVRYTDDAGNLVDGKVVEKCRWGALVLRDAGAIVAVGFRKLWPSTSHGAA
jgi:hypothetical protein